LPNAVSALVHASVGIKISAVEAAFQPLRTQASALAKVLNPAAELHGFLPTIAPSVRPLLQVQEAGAASLLSKINAQQRTFNTDLLRIAEKHSLVNGLNISKTSSLVEAIQPPSSISRNLVRSLQVRSPLANLDITPQIRLMQPRPSFKLPDYGAVSSAMAPSWGNSLKPDAPLFDLGLSEFVAHSQTIFREAFGDLLGGWTQDLFGATRGFLRAVARMGLEAALRARQAVMSGDTSEVDCFITEWLELRATRVRREVVIDVLLSDEWLPTSLEPPSTEVVRLIKALAVDKNRTRRYRFIGETQIKGQRIQSLDRSVHLPSGGETPLAETVADPYGDPALVADLGWDDPLIAKVLAHLGPVERKIFLAHGQVNTWGDAAALAGRSEAEGESTRRKVRRFVQRHQQREQAARRLRGTQDR
jgi:hypothetical protein